MAKIGTIIYDGKSRTEYTFEVYDFPGEWNSVAGVYLITRRVQNSKGGWDHTLLYVGETDDLKSRMTNHHKQLCFNSNGATCLCWLGETRGQKRLEIESDIYNKWNPKCND